MQGRVLVVEDRLDWSKKLKGILEREGHSVWEAPNYDKALSFLQKELFDVVVLDLRLVDWDATDFSGMSLLDDIDKSRGEQGTNVIIVTGYGTVEHSIEAFKKYNVFDFLGKNNFDFREFKKIVGKAVEDAHAKRAALV